VPSAPIPGATTTQCSPTYPPSIIRTLTFGAASGAAGIFIADFDVGVETVSAHG
jgi:hypothetical protein